MEHIADRTLIKMVGRKDYEVFRAFVNQGNEVGQRALQLLTELAFALQIPRYRRAKELYKVETAIKEFIKLVKEHVRPSATFKLFVISQELELIISEYAEIDSKFINKFCQVYKKTGEEKQKIHNELRGINRVEIPYQTFFKGEVLERMIDVCSWLAGASSRVAQYNEIVFNESTIAKEVEDNLFRLYEHNADTYLWKEDLCPDFIEEMKFWYKMKNRVSYLQELVKQAETEWTDIMPDSEKKEILKHFRGAITRADNLVMKLRGLIMTGEFKVFANDLKK